MNMHCQLTPFPVAEAMRALSGAIPQARIITMRVQQWDDLLAAAYSAGFILLELDENENPVGAYRRAA